MSSHIVRSSVCKLWKVFLFIKLCSHNGKVVKSYPWKRVAGGPHLIGKFARFVDTQPLQSSLWGEDLQPFSCALCNNVYLLCTVYKMKFQSQNSPLHTFHSSVQFQMLGWHAKFAKVNCDYIHFQSPPRWTCDKMFLFIIYREAVRFFTQLLVFVDVFQHSLGSDGRDPFPLNFVSEIGLWQGDSDF